jgi:heat shock protein HslJ
MKMTLNRLTLSLLLAISFPAALIGCQSNIAKNSSILNHSIATGTLTAAPVSSQPIIQTQELEENQEIITIDTEATNEKATEATTLQWASNYHWQLTQVKDKKSNAINVNTATPITLEVVPSSLNLSQGCQHFAIKFVWMSAPPFEYGSELIERPSTCESATENKVSNTNIKKLFPNDNNIIKLDVELLPVAKSNLVNTQMASKNLVVKIENGNTLTFDGTPRTFKEPTGLPINKALLERYKWRLISAVHNTFNDKRQIMSRQTINNFYHPEHFISLEFRRSPDSSYIAFNSNCNGSSASYFLLNDNTFKVGTIISTVMGCGETGNRIESALFDLMRDNSSQLTLSLQPSQPISPIADNQTDMPRYNLLQTMATGETLVWQNEVKKIP